MTLARWAGAVAILTTGGIHVQQLIVEDFQSLPTLHVLFLLNAIGSGVVGLCLLAPLHRVLPERSADTAEALLAAVGLTIAVGSLAGLFIAETSSLFGLSSHGHYSTPAVLAIIVEGIAVLLLTPLLISSGRRALLTKA